MDEKTTLAEIEALELETKRVNHQIALINLEIVKETVAQHAAAKVQKSRENKQRQGELRTRLVKAASIANDCTHRQGGGLKTPRKGKMSSALVRVIMPDERELIMCSLCPLRVWSPREVDKSPKPRGEETAQEAKARVARYKEEKAEFDILLEHSQQKLTDEAAAPMHCGTQFKFKDQDGRDCDAPAPVDSYAQGRDNRKVAAA